MTTTTKKPRRKNQPQPVHEIKELSLPVLCELIRQRAGGRFTGFGAVMPKTLGEYLENLLEVKSEAEAHADDEPISIFYDLADSGELALQEFIGQMDFGTVYGSEGMSEITESIGYLIEDVQKLIAIVGPAFPLDRV